MWAGGADGAADRRSSITFAQPRIGATATIGILIAGQLAMGAVIDRFGLFGVDQIAISWPRALGIVLLGGRRSAVARPGEPREAKVWTALWAVYIIWGSTYLGDRGRRRDDPADARRLDALHRRRGDHGRSSSAGAAARCASRAARFASCALIGCLLPGANAVLFFAEREVPTGLASLLIASVPLLVVVLRLLGRRAAARRRALAGVGVGFVGVAVLAQPSGGATGRRDRALRRSRR